MGARRCMFALLALAACATATDWIPHPDCEHRCDASNMCVSKLSTTGWGLCAEGSAELARELVVDEQTCWLSHKCTSSRICSSYSGKSQLYGPETTSPMKLAGCERADCWNWPGAGLWQLGSADADVNAKDR